MATPRRGKPYIWVTWLSGLLGGQQCLWSGWFKAHFQYDKFEQNAQQLVEWNRDHTALMRARRAQLEAEGWQVSVEDQNSFKFEGEAAVVAGKPDIIARVPGHAHFIDGKTGRQRESDTWQVLIYLFLFPKVRRVDGDISGEVHYKRGDERVPVLLESLTDDRKNEISNLVKVLAGPTAPSKAPSRYECDRCNIGRRDCPERWREDDDRADAIPREEQGEASF